MTKSHVNPEAVKTPARSAGPRDLMRAIATDPRLTPLAFRALYTLSALAGRDSFTSCAPRQLAKHLAIPGRSHGIPRALALLELHGYLTRAEVYCPTAGRSVSGVRITLDLTQLRTLRGGLPATLDMSRPETLRVSARATEGLGPRHRVSRAETSDVSACTPGATRARASKLQRDEKRGKPSLWTPGAVAIPAEPLVAPPPSASPLEPPAAAAPSSADPAGLVGELHREFGRMPGAIPTAFPTPAERQALEELLVRAPDPEKLREHADSIGAVIRLAGRDRHWRRFLTPRALADKLSTIAPELRDKERRGELDVIATELSAADLVAAAAKKSRAKYSARVRELERELMPAALVGARDFAERDANLTRLVGAQLRVEFPPAGGAL